MLRRGFFYAAQIEALNVGAEASDLRHTGGQHSDINGVDPKLRDPYIGHRVYSKCQTFICQIFI
jgi:hypothetical protein